MSLEASNLNDCPLICVCLMSLTCRFKFCIFGRNMFESDAGFLSVHPVVWHLTLICPIIGDGNFDQFVKVMSVEF